MAVPERSEHEALIGRYLDGVADSAEAQRLSRLIETDRAVADLYARLGHLHGMLAESEALEGCGKAAPLPPSARERANSAVKSLPFLLLGGPIRAADRWSTATALLLSYFVFYGAFFSLLWSLRPQPQGRDPRQAAELAELSAQSVAKGVATLVEASECDWDAGQPPASQGGRITTAQVLRLRSGRAVLRFDGGAEVGIVGPVEARATSVGYVVLERGRLAAHVPTRAFGFTVETASARLVDLGTDFAVDVNETGETTMTVTRGAVEVAMLDQVGEKHRASESPVRVTAGQSVTVSSSGQALAVERSTKPLEWVKELKLSDDSGLAVIAYQTTNGASGNQGNEPRGIGLDFDATRPIRVEALGAFDHLGDGIDPQSEIVVQLWSRDDRGTPENQADDLGGRVLAEEHFSASSQGVLMAGHRFKSLATPIVLPAGSYSIVGYGFSEANRNINIFSGGVIPRMAVETWRGAIVHINSRWGGVPGTFPDHPSHPKEHCYVTASFKFRPVEPSGNADASGSDGSIHP